MNAPTINDAREIGRHCNAPKVAIITMDGPEYSITTWGKTIGDCRSMARWAESTQATETLEAIANTLPTAGVIDVAFDPDASRLEDTRKSLLTEINEIVSLERGLNPDALANRIYDLMRQRDAEARS